MFTTNLYYEEPTNFSASNSRAILIQKHTFSITEIIAIGKCWPYHDTYNAIILRNAIFSINWYLHLHACLQCNKSITEKTHVQIYISIIFTVAIGSNNWKVDPVILRMFTVKTYFVESSIELIFSQTIYHFI